MSNTKTRPFFKRVFSDPLFHFLVLGAALYLLAPLVGNKESSKDEITITTEGQKHLADLFELTWQRTVTADELSNLVQEHIKEEIYYREALALGLDENDTIVRRRMRQKLEFMQEDLSSAGQPTEAELQAYFTAHKDSYKSDRILSFRQVLVSSKRGGVGNEVAQALKALKSGARPADISRSSLLPIATKLETKKSVTNTFGEGFMHQITGLKPKQWDGPLISAFGTHLVYVNLDQASTSLDYKTARPKVLVDYIQLKRDAAASNYYENLRNQYRITIEDQK